MISELNSLKHLLKKGSNANSPGVKILLKHVEE